MEESPILREEELDQVDNLEDLENHCTNTELSQTTVH